LHRWDEWFEANAEGLVSEDGRLVPIVAAIGNHEVRRGFVGRHPDFEDSDAWRMANATYFYQLFAFPGHPGYGTLDFGDYLSLIILDSEHTNRIPGRQTAWLHQALEKRAGQRHVIPVYHVPAFPSHRGYDDTASRLAREHWLPLFDIQGNIRVAFEHHDHTYKRTPPIRGLEVSRDDGIVYVGDGAWGVATRPVHDPETTWYLDRAESVRHAIIMTIHGDTLDFEVVSEDGDIIDRFSLGEDNE
ncbi:MAG: metallophosphoesterase, partial [Planctomycetota bacterium]